MREHQPRLCRVAGRAAWHIRDGSRRLSTGCESRAQAEQFLADYLAHRDRKPATSISAILACYLDNRAAAKIPGLQRLAYAHKPLAQFFADKPPEIITDRLCRDYQQHRTAAGIAVATIRTELQALRAALAWAHSTGLTAATPVIALPSRGPARERWLTRDEAARLLDACIAPHVRLFAVIALHTGARKGAILALTWDRVDLVNRRIDLRDPSRSTTRKRAVRVPVNDTLHAELIAAQERATSAAVVEYAGGEIASIRHALDRAAARAGLTGVTPHVFRHTAATWMAQAGVPLWEIAGMLGNTTAMIEQVYGHHSPDHLSRAARALG
jgi:integrase